VHLVGDQHLSARPLLLARRVKDQRQRERGKKLYSLHAPEMECIGKGKAHKPYEFDVKVVSVATPLQRSYSGQFVAHVKALSGNPYDGHTLAIIILVIESSIGASLGKIVTDAGYRGHNPPKDKMFNIHVAGHKRGLTKARQTRSPTQEPPSNPSSAISRATTAWAATSWSSRRRHQQHRPRRRPLQPSASCSTG
jgi:hypothetical protein